MFWLDELAWKITSTTVLLIPWFIFCSFAGVSYTVLLHGLYGQTVGKCVMRVKVFDLSGGKLSMKQAVLRDSVVLALIVYTFLVDLPTVLSGKNPYAAGAEMSFSWFLVSYATIAWFFLEIVTMLLNDKRRALHDFIAGSVVMRVSRASPQENAQPVRAIDSSTEL